MPKLTFNDLPAAIEALLLRMDILHDMVKSTKDTLDNLINESKEEADEFTSSETGQTPEDQSLQGGEDLLDLGTAAKMLGVSNSKLYMAVERKLIPYTRKQNRIFIHRKDLDTFRERVKERRKQVSVRAQDEPTMVLGDDTDRLLTMDEASEYTGFSKTNLYSYVKTKKVPFVKQGRRLLFPLVALNQLILQSASGTRRRGGRKKKGVDKPEPDNFVPDPDLVTLREVVKIVGKHPSTVYYQLRKKNIPVVARQGNRTFYSLKAVKQAFSEQDNK